MPLKPVPLGYTRRMGVWLVTRTLTYRGSCFCVLARHQWSAILGRLFPRCTIIWFKTKTKKDTGDNSMAEKRAFVIHTSFPCQYLVWSHGVSIWWLRRYMAYGIMSANGLSKSHQFPDGADVVWYHQNVFLKWWTEMEDQMCTWDEDSSSSSLNSPSGPATLYHCHTVAWHHDECVFYANDCCTSCWVHKDASPKPYMKGEGVFPIMSQQTMGSCVLWMENSQHVFFSSLERVMMGTLPMMTFWHKRTWPWQLCPSTFLIITTFSSLTMPRLT